jgi:hypothetical protein
MYSNILDISLSGGCGGITGEAGGQAGGRTDNLACKLPSAQSIVRTEPRNEQKLTL